MKRNFKGLLAIACLTFAGINVQAQAQTQGSVFDNLSVEAQYGLNSALSPNEGITTSDYSGFNFFQLGLNYHLNDVWGVRGTFASSNFKHKDVEDHGVKYSRLMLEATYNIFAAVNGGMMQPFDVTAHAGFGLASGKSELGGDNDLAGVAQIGIMPKYNFTSQFSVFIDGTFVNQFSQDYGFNGGAIKQGSGSYFNVGLGVQYKFKK
ncbi:outer membrane insertion C-terminal signal [Paenimyroides ummariense]|uniref:Outer membrane insertion C-terminal signal n=1 Tax=Paenimyroides ummariense TaxID=913024 RepID=A0A1I5APL3_9FLAO|nr:outer membrane beta-barrel protein [Paenimyroides ummariense]SFN64357.1 outer membrane insertion C-terminal signal [Paenimyroides ummariense]